MKIGIINVNFKGRREDRNTVSQLKTDNDYSLTENNSSRINKAIENLSNEKGESNVRFLIDVAENLTYSTGIDTGLKPRHDWKLKLKEAAQKSLTASDPITREKLSPVLHKVFDSKKPLSPDEKEILAYRDNILKNIDKSQLADVKNPNIKDIERNLNYFIISSETPVKQKKYILNRFDYFLSPEYKINPQLNDKKTLVLAEMLNDLALNTGKNTVPNTKAINQKQHGMCAAISIARKLMSYEYKAKYVDMLLSELDDLDVIMAYDLTKPRSGKKVPIHKTYVDYNDALAKGYRVVDASTTNWMQAAGMYGAENKIVSVYTPFDANHYDTFSDSFFFRTMNNNSGDKQVYYQALLKAKENVDSVKANNLIKSDTYHEKQNRLNSDLKILGDLNTSIKQKLQQVIPSVSGNKMTELFSAVSGLQVDLSEKIDRMPENMKKYHFIPNEEDSVKLNKIKNYITDFYGERVDKNALEKNIGDIKDLLEMYRSVADGTHIKSTMAGKIAKDRMLYEAAASYRTANIMALNDEDLLTDAMIHYNLPDAETLLFQKIDEIQQKIENGNSSYVEHIAKTYDINPDKETVLAELDELKNALYEALTEQLDGLFYMLGINDRITALTNQVKELKNKVESGDENALALLSETLKTKPDKKKFTQILSEYIEILEDNPDYGEYCEIYNNLGYKSQLKSFRDAFQIMADALDNPDDYYNAAIIENFKKANEIPDNATILDLKKQLEYISGIFNGLAESVAYIMSSFDIVDENENLLDSANPRFSLVKLMENEGKIVSGKELLKLRTRYNAIDKLRSADEFSSRHGKISDTSLYHYTKEEKETLKKIKKNINFMYSDINKELTSIYREIRQPLEDYARKTGVITGNYWVGPEGRSGLTTEQQTRILQQLTDEPYRAVENVNDAVEIIKNTPHSGISDTSVFHDKIGLHSQYIAEIAERNGKDVLFNDNTWGGSEHENIWVDSEGLVRTDYSDRRGGESGYITDDKWRNGNYIEDLTEKSGKFVPREYNRKYLNNHKGRSEEYKFPLYWDTLLQGNPKQAESIAAGIKENVFLPDSLFIEDLEKFAATKTVQDIKNEKIKIDGFLNAYHTELRQITDRINETPFNKPIPSAADFDALPENDALRLTFEKAALEMSGEYTSKWKEIAKASSVSGLKKIKDELRQEARERFDYAFSKEPKVLYAYALNKSKAHIVDIVNSALKNNGINLSEQDKAKIISRTAMYENEEIKNFDGSLAHTIDFLVNKLLKQFDSVVPDSENARSAKAQIRKELTKDVGDALYFNENDLKKDTKYNIAIKNYIDKKYNPETNEDFVKIYRMLQDMTIEEFKKETADVTDADMAFKNYTGYDILKMYNVENSQVKSLVTNLVYQKHLLNNLDLSETTPSYKYKKLQKKLSGVIYNNGRTFDDLYLSFRNSLMSLTYEKMFNGFKDEAYRKYKVLPGYPKVDVMGREQINEKVDSLLDVISAVSVDMHNNKLNLGLYAMTDRLHDLFEGIKEDRALTDDERTIVNNIAGMFTTEFFNDKALKRSVEAAIDILSLKPDAKLSEYKAIFARWYDESEALKKNNPPESIMSTLDEIFKTAKQNLDFIVRMEYPEKYQNIIKEDLHNLLRNAAKSRNTFYDAMLGLRKLENKINYSSKEDVSDDEKTAFFNRLDVLIQKLKRAKVVLNDNQYKRSMEHKKLTDSTAAFSVKFGVDMEELSDTIQECIDNPEFTKDKVITRIGRLASSEAIQPGPVFNNLIENIMEYGYASKLGGIYYKNLENHMNALNNVVSNFVNDCIKENYQDAVSMSVSDFIEESLSSSNGDSRLKQTGEYWEDKLRKDAEKYHILKYPVDILERFLTLAAKDGKIAQADTPEEKNKYNTELKRAKDYLDIAMALASVVDMQELLMDAVSIGNPALVAEKFKNHDTDLVDDVTGMPLSMSDEKAIDYIVRSLILENDNDSAVNFVETLGLTDKFLRAEDEIFDVDEIKKDVDKIVDVLKETNAINLILQSEIQKYDESCDNDENFIQRLDETKQSIIEKTEGTSRPEVVRMILSSFDMLKDDIITNPGLSKYSLLLEAMGALQDSIKEKTNNDLEPTKEKLDILNSIYQMISKLHVPEYTEGYKYKKSIDEKYEIFRDYNNNALLNVVNHSAGIQLIVTQ